MPARPTVATLRPLPPAVPLHLQLYRYFFYGWLFRDAYSGSEWERSLALRHNVEQARWLPVYLLRWVSLGGVLLALELFSERITRDGDSMVSALLALGLIFAVMYTLITFVCWAFLRARPRSRPDR